MAVQFTKTQVLLKQCQMFSLQIFNHPNISKQIENKTGRIQSCIDLWENTSGIIPNITVKPIQFLTFFFSSR
jgi:hypothetical protein